MITFDIIGNVIPHSWYKHIQTSGKPDINAIVILAEIVYWYRPTRTTLENGGYEKRFKGDLLQKSYKDLRDHFGFTDKQIRDALERLEKRNLCRRVFRNIEVNGVNLYNVMFIEVFADNIKAITIPNSSLNEQKYTATAFNSAPNTNTSETKKKADTLPYSEIVDYLNSSAGTSYRATSAKTKTLIKARCKEGFTLDEFKKVIDNKCAAWLGTDMAKFLRPETLFGTKFESYLNEEAAQKNRQSSGGRQMIEAERTYQLPPDFKGWG